MGVRLCLCDDNTVYKLTMGVRLFSIMTMPFLNHYWGLDDYFVNTDDTVFKYTMWVRIFRLLNYTVSKWGYILLVTSSDDWVQ